MDKQRQITEYISRKLRARREKFELSVSEMAQRVAPCINLNPSTLTYSIKSYEHGDIYGGKTSRIGIERNGRVYLARLSMYIKQLDFGTNEVNHLVNLVRLLDDRFDYPPDESMLIKLTPGRHEV